MSFNLIYCAAFEGLEAREVEIEVSFTRALPSFQITGLAGSSIQESKQRIQSSLLASSFKFPPLKITINLSPSDLPKQGSFYDLPIALLIALQNFHDFSQIGQEQNKKWFAFGELGLDGRVKNTEAIYPLLFSLLSKIQSNTIFILPKDGKDIYSKLPNINAYFVETLQEAIEIIKNPPEIEQNQNDLPYAMLKIKDKKYYYSQDFPLDFFEIKGQERAKRAALIAAIGFHNLLLEGSAGSGKSMIASRLPYVLPPLKLEEILQIAATNNTLELSPFRPFRNPHNSATKAAILGSAVANNLKFGEIALANLGLLFLDELPHFQKNLLESLREPLENHYFCVSRSQTKVTYATDFLFCAAMNPCPCGNLLSVNKECRCNEKEIKAYKNKLSEPFLDRIDIFVQMQEGQDSTHKISSKSIQEQVLSAFVFQKERGQECFNARLKNTEIERFCKLGSEEEKILEMAINRFGISLRQKNKILCVARSIADLEKSADIQKAHLMEALSFRRI